MSKGKGKVFGRGHFGALDGWAEDVATRVNWRVQEDRGRAKRGQQGDGQGGRR